MTSTESAQHRKAVAFRDLHHRGHPFVLANAWDSGTARILTGAGFDALGTSSAGLAFGLGVADGVNLLDRDLTLHNARLIVEATPLPVSADLESGFSDTAAGIEDTILRAADAGLVGCSIEDATGRPDAPILDLDGATDRVRHAVLAARSLPFPFTVTARAENFLYGHPDLDDTIRRLRAYAGAGADVLFAPALPDRAAVREVCATAPRPVNVLIGGLAPLPSVAELGGLGAARVSLGSLLARTALGAVQRAAQEVHAHGTFDFAAQALPYPQLNAVMSTQGQQLRPRT